MNKYSMYKEAYKQAIYWHINNNPELLKVYWVLRITSTEWLLGLCLEVMLFLKVSTQPLLHI